MAMTNSHVMICVTFDLAPDERLPRLKVYYQFWRNEHDGNRAGALQVGVQARGG